MEKSRLIFENYRQIRILQLLIDSTSPLTADAISSNLNVSSRLIRYDMTYLKAMLKKNDIYINSIRGQGYSFSDKSATHKALREMTTQNRFLFDKLGTVDNFLREQLILRILLLKDTLVTYQELMDMFFISRSTLLKDLTRAQETIEPYYLQLIQIPYHGIEIRGNELHKRMMLGRELAFYKNHDLLSYIHEELNIRDITVEQLADLIENQFHYGVSNIGLFNIYAHLSIMQLRIRQNKIINRDELHLDETFTENQLEISQNFLKKYFLDEYIPIEEIQYFLVLVKSNCYDVSLPKSKKEEYYLLNKNVLNEMKLALNYVFYQDELLKHLSALLYSQHIRIINNVVNNPLLIRSIKKYSPLSLELAYRYSKTLNKYMDIRLYGNDICNISHYFYNYSNGNILFYKWNVLIIGAHGKLLEKRFIEQIKTLFHRVKITYVEIHKLHEIRSEKFDLIIANVTTDVDFSTEPFVQVNYFLKEQNILKIREVKDESIFNKYKNAINKMQTIHVNTAFEVLKWYCNNQTVENPNHLLKSLVERNEAITYEVRKKFAIICLFENENIKSMIVYVESGIRWKSAVINYVIFINVLSQIPLAYYEWEGLITHFDDVLLKIKESKC